MRRIVAVATVAAARAQLRKVPCAAVALALEEHLAPRALHRNDNASFAKGDGARGADVHDVLCRRARLERRSLAAAHGEKKDTGSKPRGTH